MATSHRRLQLFLASFLLLYFELAMIRWIPGHVRVLAYFTNFILIGCFFGMGLGLLLTRARHDFSPFISGGIAVMVAAAAVFKGLWVTADSGEGLFLEYEGPARMALALGPALVVFYVGIALAFLPFGQIIGRAFQGDSLADYSINLIGSLAGIAVFSVYSMLALPAWAWFALGLPLLLVLVPSRLLPRLATLGCAVLLVFVVHTMDRGVIWSPYYKLEITRASFDPKTLTLYPFAQDAGAEPLPLNVAFNLRVNDDFYQLPVDRSDAAVARYPGLRSWRDASFTVCKLRIPLDRVLIVGGGTGNDAAAALRCGAKHVDVVDIDPSIVRIGRQMHPEHPYSDPRVHVIVDDARHFFHGAVPGYDAIVFALLDSHTLASTRSSLRLDSYVFTVEAFKEARRLLSPRGVQITAFAAGQDWMRSRFYEMLRTAYGKEPVIADENGIATVGAVFISGPGSVRATGMSVHPRRADPAAVLATDNWPFIYARAHRIPNQYVWALAMILFVSFFAVRWTAGGTGLPNLHFFCLGAGFLLLETRNITAIALAFGSTWYVNSVVFASILAMALLANLLMARLRAVDRVPTALLYGALLAALAVNWYLPVEALAGMSLPVRLVTVGGVSALPVFFSGMIFARSFKKASDPVHALGSNVLGAIVGGALEYLSLVAGLQFLILLMAALYVASAAALIETERLRLVPVGRRL
jgi:SAM-dependent methyltransferase